MLISFSKFVAALEVDRLRTDNARNLVFSYNYSFRGYDARIYSRGGISYKPVVAYAANHHANLVHMGTCHYTPFSAFLMRIKVAHRVRPYLVGILRYDIFDISAHLALVAAYAVYLSKFL